MYGVGITPAVLAAFFWKRANAYGGVSSIAAGMSVTIIWEILGNPFDIPTIYPALLASLFCLVAVSLIKERPPEESWRPFYMKTSNEAL